MNQCVVVVDPGSLGAIVWRGPEGLVDVKTMPGTPEGILESFRNLFFMGIHEILIEDVGTYMPGNSGPAAVTFARHCGHLDMAAIAVFGKNVHRVRPQKWYKSIPTTQFEPILRCLDEKEKQKERQRRQRIHKGEIKDFMQARHPAIRITLKNADAFAMLHWYETERELV